MTGNQNNDNLERFFKANLERYSPTPSDDFWARMEPAIPAKPSFWAGWASAVGRWAGLGLLVAAVATVLLLWLNDRRQLDRLSKTVAQQQQQLEQLGEAAKKSVPSTASQPSAAAIVAPQKTAAPAPQAATDGPVFAQQKNTATAAGEAVENLPRTKNASPKTAPNLFQKGVQAVESQVVANEPDRVEQRAGTEAAHEVLTQKNRTTEEFFERSTLSVPPFLAFGNTTVALRTVRLPSLKFRMFRPQKTYPRYSVESGMSAFVMPVGRLFLSDTLYTGRAGLSYNVGLLVNYEINNSVAFQGGYQFKNLRSTRLALRYNSFPVSVCKRWALNRRRYLEANAGLSLNSLVNARTDTDGQSVKGLKPTWLGLHGSLAATLPLTDRLTFVAGPTAGFSLTPMAGNRRTWEAGIGVNLRYSLW